MPPRMGTARRALLGLCALLAASTVAASDVRWDTNNLARYRFLYGAPVGFPGGHFTWHYHPQDEPAGLAGQMPGIFQRAIGAWARHCAVSGNYQGERRGPTVSGDWMSGFGWDPALVMSNAGEARVRTVGMGHAASIAEGDIVLVPGNVGTARFAYTVAVHEVGHILGLQHSDVYGAVMSGGPETAYSYSDELAADDIEGCQAIYNNPYCTTPRPPDERRVTAGTCPVGMSGGRAARRSYGCQFGEWTPNPWFDAGEQCDLLIDLPSAPAQVKEYTRTTADESSATPLADYFITADPAEQQALERPGSAWKPTGSLWHAWRLPDPKLTPVCRFYGDRRIDITTGRERGPDAHFFTASPTECTQLPLRFPAWQLETAAAFQVRTAEAETCPLGTLPIVRFFRPWGPPAHRYALDASIENLMRQLRWVREGVVFCAADPRYVRTGG